MYKKRFILESENKYHSQKTECSHGHIHDSKKEALRCNELHMLLRGKQIRDLEIQKSYLIIPAIYNEVDTKEVYKRGDLKGKLKKKRVCVEEAAYYNADFVYFDKQLGKMVIEDCKGKRTKDYILKRKLVKQQYCDDNTIFLET